MRSAMAMPSVKSSPWILGAPHRGLAAAMFLIKVLISALTGGRPAGGASGELGPVPAKAKSLPA